MDAINKANCEKLLAELETMRARLAQISEAAFGDMEGADMPDFAISEVLYGGCEDAANNVATVIHSVTKLINDERPRGESVPATGHY